MQDRRRGWQEAAVVLGADRSRAVRSVAVDSVADGQPC